ncbi:peptidoglycan-associated lipoprotein Pal [Pontixanthobacter gangjinensis]|uniref:Peptidoglycan-associated lipoprotein n=1 Tax=Pontixanthobacter gangjinensis TaxID=1028742 RepID=A0A6I4SKN9_9SPHN|nr:peptidoglycan-associated lipoprotein Pal [Pontixanthobacter gangjinensis]MXO56273.1 peptidoglycan-associated lipoprotein Pal [Pontixanthobacter gangjinensis]
MNTRFATIAIITAGTLALAGCKTKAPDILPPTSTGPVQTAQTDTTPVATGPSFGSQEHFVDAVNGQNVIYFDTDRFNIDTADAAALQSQAQYLMRYTNITVTIEGHADERGTRDYNLALGERRANSAKNYLTSLGVPASRISTVSYGKERPVAVGSNEQAWAQNRRAVTVVIGR